MSYLKKEAIELVNSLYERNRINVNDHYTILEALEEIELLRDRDDQIEDLWCMFEDVPMNPETERIEENFYRWNSGTHREEIWTWFDQRYSKGVYALLYGDGQDRTPDFAKMVYLNSLCGECEADNNCMWCVNGECRYPLVFEKKPAIEEKNGRQNCRSFCTIMVP